MRTTIAALAVAFLALILAACGPRAQLPTTFEVVLTGAQEVPPVDTAAEGTTNVTILGHVLTIDGAWGGMVVTGAHIHGPAPAGENAGILLELAYDNPSTHFEGTFTLTSEQLGWFSDGLLYINLHSAEYPAGEIRGQIVP